MFESVADYGHPKDSIVVQTSQGREIENTIAPHPSEKRIRELHRLEERCGQHWQRRKDECGIYNCAGHVWADRRTAIYDANDEIAHILEDDGYRRVARAELCRPDDLVIYFTNNRDFLHVARVLNVEEGITSGSDSSLWVLSKWDDGSAEYEHYHTDVPFPVMSIHDFDITFWTDRRV